MATDTLETPETRKKREDREKKEEGRRLRRRGPSASEIYLSLAQKLFKTQEQTPQEQLAAIQFMMEYIQAVGFLHVVFSWDQRDELALMTGSGPEIGDSETSSLLKKCIHILIGMVSTPKDKAKLSDPLAKEPAQSPEPASERGNFSEMIGTIVREINASLPEVKDQFRQILKTLESEKSISHRLIEFSKSPDFFSKHKVTHPDKHQQLTGVRCYIYLMALMKLADSNPENQVFQEAYNSIILKLYPGFTLIIRRKLHVYIDDELPVADTREILRCLVRLIESQNLQKKPKPEPVIPLVKVVPKGKGGGGVTNLEDTKKPDPRKAEWMKHQTLTLEEVNETLFPERSIIPEDTTMFDLAIRGLAKNLSVAKYFRSTNSLKLPRDRQLSVKSLLDCLTENFGDDDRLLMTVEGAIYGAIEKGEITKSRIVKLIMQDEGLLERIEKFKQSRRLKQSKESELIKKYLPQNNQRKQNNSDPTT